MVLMATPKTSIASSKTWQIGVVLTAQATNSRKEINMAWKLLLPVVQVGTSIIVVRDRKVLVGRRKGSHAAGLISFPGGHLDFGETWTACARRELREECGKNMKVGFSHLHGRLDWFLTNDIMPKYGKHYITIFMVARWLEGKPINTEPHKCEGWKWITFEELACLGDKAAQWIPIGRIESLRHEIGI